MDGASVSQKEYFEALLVQHEQRHKAEMDGLKELMEARFLAQQTAVDKSEEAYNSRFALANEFRDAMKDLSGTFATKKTVDEKVDEMSRRFSVIEQWQARTNGQFATWGIALTVLTTVIAIVGRFVNLGGG